MIKYLIIFLLLIIVSGNPAGLKIEFYGNWCGPGHPEDIHNAPEPIDAIDYSCKEHDLCYVDKSEKECDQIFIEALKRIQMTGDNGEAGLVTDEQMEKIETMKKMITLKMLFMDGKDGGKKESAVDGSSSDKIEESNDVDIEEKPDTTEVKLKKPAPRKTTVKSKKVEDKSSVVISPIKMKSGTTTTKNIKTSRIPVIHNPEHIPDVIAVDSTTKAVKPEIRIKMWYKDGQDYTDDDDRMDNAKIIAKEKEL